MKTEVMKTMFWSTTLLAVAMPVSAATFTTTDVLSYHNDVGVIPFFLYDDSLAGETVNVWTTSHGEGSFDPVLALWQWDINNSNGIADSILLGFNEDRNTVLPGQGSYDATFSLPSLEAGIYFFTVTEAWNWPNGLNGVVNGAHAFYIHDPADPPIRFGEGFYDDADTPVPFPAGKGDYNVWISGIGDLNWDWGPPDLPKPLPPIPSVPEPAILGLFGIGALAALAVRRRKRI
jgi:hypothetical protein